MVSEVLTARFTDFFTDFEKKTDCFAVYHLGGGFTSQYAPVGWEFAKICNDGGGGGGRGFN